MYLSRASNTFHLSSSVVACCFMILKHSEAEASFAVLKSLPPTSSGADLDTGADF